MKRLLILVFLFWASCVDADEPKQVSAEQKKALPVPPQQQTAWALPRTIKDPQGTITRSIELMFQTGMPDPRGLPYHHVKVMDEGKLVAARGWVLPPNQKQRYAIGWSGMIYPVAEVDEPADLKTDIAILTKHGRFCEEPFDNYQEESLGDVIAKFRGVARMMHPFAAPYLLLRLGEPIFVIDRTADPVVDDTADPFAEEHAHHFEENDGAHDLMEWRTPDYDYVALAEFGIMHRDDGVAAWIDGDFHLASERLKSFDAIWHEAEKRCPKEAKDDIDPFTPGPLTLDGLNGAWRDLLVDAKRRLSPAPAFGASAIEQAIASWDQIDVWSEKNQPPSFRLVTSAGPLAIKPLLECLEQDERWTRVVNKEDDNTWTPRVIRVRDLALVALESVLEFSFESMPYKTPTESAWYDEAATKLRTLCERYEYQWGPELWYRILADPQSDLDYQLKAVNAMVTPYLEISNPYYHWFSAEHGGACCEASEFAKSSEVLRDRANPTVLELMERVWQRERKRVDEALKDGAQEVPTPFYVSATPNVLRESAHHVVHCMEDWSPGNVEVLRSHYQWLRQGLDKQWEKEDGSDYSLRKMCEQTLIRRFKADDKTVIADFEEFFRASMPHGDLPIKALLGIPASPELDMLVAEAFLGKDALLNLVHRAWELYDSKRDSIAWNSPLLKYPSFRKALIEGLQSTTVQATLSLTPDKAELLFHASQPKGPDTLYQDEALRPDRTTTKNVDIRVCDLIAYFLTPGVGYQVWNSLYTKETAWLAPEFYLDDPVDQRDKAIAEWIERLKAYH